MKREILFRGKRVDGKGWSYGNLCKCENFRGDIFYEIGYGKKYYRIIHETIGQFTGLTDKHGTNIFKGDMVIERLPDACEPQGYYDCKSVVEFIQGCWVLSQVGFDYSNTPLYERSFLFEANNIELT